MAEYLQSLLETLKPTLTYLIDYVAVTAVACVAAIVLGLLFLASALGTALSIVKIWDAATSHSATPKKRTIKVVKEPQPAKNTIDSLRAQWAYDQRPYQSK